MMIRLKALALVLLLGIGTAPVPGRAGPLEPTDLYMVLSMGGVTAGSLKLSIDPEGDRITSLLKMKSQGMFKLLTGYKSRSEASSTHSINGKGPMPVSYDSIYETRKTERKVLIRYDAGDGQITDLQTWKRGKPRKNKIAEDLRRETIDPLTAVLRLRHWIGEIRSPRLGAEAASTHRFEIFDGRRRYRLDTQLLDRQKVDFDGKKTQALRFKVQMKPLAGFSSSDMLANWASEDGQRWIELIVTDDDNPVPVHLSTKGGSLETSVYLRKVCIGDGGCRKVDG